MRNESKMINPTLAPDLLRKQYELAQNQRYAQMLMEDGSQMPQGQMVSGHYVAPSITQYLAQALKSGLGGSIARGAPDQMADVSQAQRDSVYSQFGLGGSTDPQALAGALAGGQGGQQGGMMPSIPGMSREQQAMIAMNIGLPEYLKLAANKGGPVNIAPGGSLYNPQTGQVDYTAPKDGIAIQGGRAVEIPGYIEAQARQAGRTTAAQEGAKAALDLVELKRPDGSSETKTRADAAKAVSQGGQQGTAPSGQLGVSQSPANQAFDVEMSKDFADRFRAIQAASGNAREMLSMYDLAEQALNTGVRTGVGADAELSLRQIGATMGIGDVDKLAGGELLRAVQNRMALSMRNPDSGMGIPGAVSDRDIKFLKDSQVGIDRSPEGNRQMLEAFRAMEQRKLDVARLANEYVQKNGRLDAGFSDVVRDFAESNPMFSGGVDLAQPGQQSQQPAQPTSRAEYDALPSGTTFRAPDGTIRRKP
jgi:hypothetical protein